MEVVIYMENFDGSVILFLYFWDGEGEFLVEFSVRPGRWQKLARTSSGRWREVRLRAAVD